MRIAILTLPLHTNYGGILQCYALQTVLQRMGHDVKVLDKPLYTRRYYFIWMLAICKRIIKKLVLRKKVSILYAPYQIERNILRKNTNIFIRKYINKYITRRWNKSLVYKFDAFIVGSDQVWRPKYAVDIELYFFSFLKNSNVLKISYAASFGIDSCDEYNEIQLRHCSDLLKKFSAISVREDIGIKLCNNYFGVNAVQTLDPTLLLSSNDYRSLIYNAYTKPMSGTMLVYVLDKTKEKALLVSKIATEKKISPCWIDDLDIKNDCKTSEIKPKISVEQWLRYFSEAEFVFTDSFHGCIFSIIFKKNFIAYGNSNRGISRFTSLLDMFSLKDRLIFSIDDYYKSKTLLNKDIDYNYVNALLLEKRNLAFNYLSASLKK